MIDTASERVRYEEVFTQVRAAAVSANRDPSAIVVLAVSKKQPVEKMHLYQSFAEGEGVTVCFGESYVQEFARKQLHLGGQYQSHLIGPLQSNKVRQAVKMFDVIQSIHTLQLSEAINEEALRLDKIQRIFLQVNISSDPAKNGCVVDKVAELYEQVSDLPGCRCEGLMAITQLYERAEQARPDFRRLRELRDGLTPRRGAGPLGLSMGMSGDFMVAIAEGATHLRIGTALFGERA